MDFFILVHYEWWHGYLGTMMTLIWTGAYDVIFCIWSMQACEFNNEDSIFAMYFFGDLHTATAQKGVRNSGDISVICSFLVL